MQPALMAAGHEGAQQGEGLFIKPSSDQEVEFYQSLKWYPSKLNEFVPEFMGTLTEKSPDQPDAQPFLVLEDLCSGFKNPAIMDVKLGRQLWDAQASAEKRERLKTVSDSTTSGSLGFRIAGMNIIESNGQRKLIGKQFGRKATAETIVDYLAAFFPNKNNEHIDSCLLGLITRLEELHGVLSEQNLEMHSASVLLIYEGDLTALANATDRLAGSAATGPGADPDAGSDSDSDSDSELDSDSALESRILDLRLIDFAHTTWANKPDADTLEGIQNLINTLTQLYDQRSSSM